MMSTRSAINAPALSKDLPEAVAAAACEFRQGKDHVGSCFTRWDLTGFTRAVCIGWGEWPMIQCVLHARERFPHPGNGFLLGRHSS